MYAFTPESKLQAQKRGLPAGWGSQDDEQGCQYYTAPDGVGFFGRDQAQKYAAGQPNARRDKFPVDPASGILAKTAGFPDGWYFKESSGSHFFITAPDGSRYTSQTKAKKDLEWA